MKETKFTTNSLAVNNAIDLLTNIIRQNIHIFTFTIKLGTNTKKRFLSLNATLVTKIHRVTHHGIYGNFIRYIITAAQAIKLAQHTTRTGLSSGTAREAPATIVELAVRCL